MVESETFSLMIQMVALFLPAWAIMVQIFGRLMEKADLDENPSLIPFFGVGLALTLFSVWMFSRAVASAIVAYMQHRIQEPSPNPLLFESLSHVMVAEMAFTTLGVIVLTIAAITYFNFYNGFHIALIVIATSIIMNYGDKYYDISVVAAGIILLIIVDIFLSKFVWPQYRDSLRERFHRLDNF